MIKQMGTSKGEKGFTIVELLIVIVVIGILAAIVIVGYFGIKQKAIAASLTSDLDGASKSLRIYQVNNSTYPLTNDCSATPAVNSICLKSTSGTTFTAFQISNSSNPQSFCLTALNDGISYKITSTDTPVAGTCSGVMSNGTTCPTGFIVVPGSVTYGTSDFCVMKYTAKNVGGVATSQAASTPWVNITQTSAISTSAAACSGCHLISEAEWMTIAQNVLSVPSNWTGGVVGGSGSIFSGHNDDSPSNALDADTNDSNGYYGTGNTSPSTQRRTLTLTNGEVIWDLAGNVWQWTSGTSTTGQPGITGETGYNWKQWTDVNSLGTLAVNPSPTGTNLPGSSLWNSFNGVGMLLSYNGETALRGFLRGGNWWGGGGAGILMLYIGSPPSDLNTDMGFRVAK